MVWLAGFCFPIGDGLKLLGICSTQILLNNVHQKIEIALENNKQGAQGGAGWVPLAAARGHVARSHRGQGWEGSPAPGFRAKLGNLPAGIAPGMRGSTRAYVSQINKSRHASAMRGFIKF